MYALSFATLPAAGIYDKAAWAPQEDIIKKCHIYFVGFTERLQFEHAYSEPGKVTLVYKVGGREYPLIWDFPSGYSIQRDGPKYYIDCPDGVRRWPSAVEIGTKLNSAGLTTFDVKYIGQAYGTDGSRNAMDRLQKHETLQKIALLGVPEGFDLQVLLLEIEPSNRLYTAINPFSKGNETQKERISSGIDKMFNTTEEERVSLYEAAFIRYFSPQYNKEFKNSFPSTRLKILQDCYEKDFLAVIAEICIDQLPWRLKSDMVEPAYFHIAKHDLHSDEDRRAFFQFDPPSSKSET